MIKKSILLLSALLLSVAFAGASAYLDTWDATTENWQIKDIGGGASYGSLDWVATLGSHSGVLRATGGAADTDPREDIIYVTHVDSGSGLGGDLSAGDLGATFDFYSDGALPQKLDVFILSGEGGNNFAWYLDVTPSLSTGWASINAAITHGAGWYNIDDGRTTEAQFNADLVDIDQIGVLLYYRDNEGAQIYGLDNFDVDTFVPDAIPEPETWAFLGIAFLSIGYSFRHRLDKALDGLKVLIRS